MRLSLTTQALRSAFGVATTEGMVRLRQAAQRRARNNLLRRGGEMRFSTPVVAETFVIASQCGAERLPNCKGFSDAERVSAHQHDGCGKTFSRPERKCRTIDGLNEPRHRSASEVFWYDLIAANHRSGRWNVAFIAFGEISLRLFRCSAPHQIGIIRALCWYTFEIARYVGSTTKCGQSLGQSPPRHGRSNRSVLAPRRTVGPVRRDLPPRFFLRSVMTEVTYSTKRLIGIPFAVHNLVPSKGD
jgi:hypothetical protein